MFCPNCGKEQEGNHPYCYNCGTMLAMDSPSKPLTEHRTIMEYAGFWKRFAASLLDGILLWIASFIVVLIIPAVFHIIYEYDLDDSYVAALLAFFYLGPISIGWLYYALMESSPKQATLGKMALGIIITDSEGKRVSFGRATGRHFAKIISTLILLIGYIMIAFTQKKQGLHDIIAETLVIVK